MSRRLNICAALGALALAAAGTVLTGTPATAQQVFHRGFGASPSTLDPHLNFGAREAWIQADLYEGLVEFGADGSVVPGAAESWDLSDDGKTYIFHLRPDLKWSNGEPLVAQDFVNGIIRTIDPRTASEKAYYFSSVIQVHNAQGFSAGEIKDAAEVGVSAPDDRTVVITLDQPAPHALNILNSFQTSPLHKPSFEKYGTEFVRPGNLVGNGAFILKEFIPQSHVLLVKNPNYWGAADVKLDEVRYHVTEDSNTELKRYQTGELDVTNEIPSDQVATIKEQFGDEAHLVASTEIMYLSFNIKKPPFDDIRVRQALSMAIDREVLQNKIIRGGYVPLYSYSPPLDPNYTAPQIAEATMSKEERQEKARQLLAEAGYGPDNPLKLTLLSTTDETEKKEGAALAIMWKQVLGVETDQQNQEFQAWLDSFYAGNWDVFNDNLVGDFPGPETYLSYMKPSADAGYNWQNQQYEELMNQAAATAEPKARYELLAKAERALLDDYLVAPIASGISRHLVKSYVKGWEDNAVESHPSKVVTIEK
jgi:oligopeptide transport system substrate-binding protein